MSPSDFRSQAQRHRREIEFAWNSVSKVSELFSQEEPCKPEKCDSVRDSLLKLSSPVQEFCSLLDTASKLPIDVVPFRYSLVIALHHVGDLVGELLLLIGTLRIFCWRSERDAMVWSQVIQHKLDELEQGSQDILHNIDILLLQTRSQEKKRQALVL